MTNFFGRLPQLLTFPHQGIYIAGQIRGPKQVARDHTLYTQSVRFMRMFIFLAKHFIFLVISAHPPKESMKSDIHYYLFLSFMV